MNFSHSDSNYNLPKSHATRNVLIVAGIVFALAAAGTAIYFFKQYSSLKKNPSVASADDTKSTIASVDKLIVLPTGEDPTVATVTDPSKLNNQAFFANAKIGDKVLLYSNAKKAILYDPSINKIVDVAPIDLSDTNAPAVSGTNSDTTK